MFWKNKNHVIGEFYFSTPKRHHVNLIFKSQNNGKILNSWRYERRSQNDYSVTSTIYHNQKKWNFVCCTKSKSKPVFYWNFQPRKKILFVRNGPMGNHRCSHFYTKCDRWGNNNREKISIVIWIPKHRNSFPIGDNVKRTVFRFHSISTSTIE